MKKYAALLLGLVCHSFVLISPLRADMAYPGLITVENPDGSSLQIQIHGDEYGNYRTTSDGYEIQQGEDGYYYYARRLGDRLTRTATVARDPDRRTAADRVALGGLTRSEGASAPDLAALRARSSLWQRPASEATEPQQAIGRQQTRSGEPYKSLVILVEFADRPFDTPDPQSAFTALLNQPGYSADGSVGSARDYYLDNSNGRFDPEFVVVGPYMLSRPMAYYGAPSDTDSDSRPREMAQEAIELANREVNFAEFSDLGIGRDVFIFYAGYAESTGGSENTIWPHRWFLRSPITVDGVRLQGYACTSELFGGAGSTLTGIGTFCHEYGHIMGWPDLYDADKQKNGMSEDIDFYALMAAGNHNDKGRRPPALTAIERLKMGWLESEMLNASGEYALEGVYNDKAYLVPTTSTGEYFLLETRSSRQNKWDAGLSIAYPGSVIEGMLVTHIDESNNVVPGSGRTAKILWIENAVNNYAAHPCLKAVKALTPARNWVFPQSGVNELSDRSNVEFMDWQGQSTGRALSDIRYADGKTYFTLSVSSSDNLSDIRTISLYQNDAEFSWEASPHVAAFEAILFEGTERLQQWQLTEPSLYVSRLTPGHSYRLLVSAVDEAGELGSARELKFSTPATTAPFASLKIAGEYAAGADVPLRVVNISAAPRSVSWHIDGQLAEPPAVQLGKGRHTVTATVTIKNGSVERFTKYVTIE
ncbi:MAG: M6 family metalloprotease domain-containing protein [Rikenellaceae bacterium]|jgi:M6 family metalloprotease-like protein|nr:M6 family metalloprotease domain-containing protein [Rikenellaceae bacterium]